MAMIDTYVALLGAIQTHLQGYNDTRWPHVLASWIADVPQNPVSLRAHVERTRQSLAGMGSIADVVIAPECGHSITADEREIRRANARLLELVAALDEETLRLTRA
ncbi:MAG TPA: hypothetical protein VF846_03570 [Thermoanaerobaculia bacterium]|jgi:hypothetical protein